MRQATGVADVAIVGAGPAGALCAWRLARTGARVLLFDPSHPREKPCGGGISSRAAAVLDGALDVSPLPGVVIRRARFIDSVAGTAAEVALPQADTGSVPLTVTSRTDFDRSVLAAAARAGAQLVTERATTVECDGRMATVSTAFGVYRASFLVGADGVNSLVRRRLARAFRRDQLSIATGFFAHGATSDEIVIEIVSDPPGYIWSFPRPTHLAIGICAQADTAVTVSQLRERTRAWVSATGLAGGARLEAYAWPIPSLDARSFETVDLAGPNWCLVGDAAGLVDPITREGIYYALASARLAADAALDGDLHRYAASVHGEILPELRRAAELKERFFRPAFTHLLVAGLQQSAAVRRVMADLVAGIQNYAGLKGRLLRTLEWRLAWQLLVSSYGSRGRL